MRCSRSRVEWAGAFSLFSAVQRHLCLAQPEVGLWVLLPPGM